MMVAEKATPRVPAEGRNEHEHHLDSSTTCAFCGDDRDVYQMGDKWICTDHIGLVVSLAANDIWPELVSYKREFEKTVLL